VKDHYLLNEVMPTYQIQRRYWVAQINARPQHEQDRQEIAKILSLVVLGTVLTACLLVLA